MKFGQNLVWFGMVWFGQNSEAEFKTNGLVKILKLNQNSESVSQLPR